jgi:hypothetical protein
MAYIMAVVNENQGKFLQAIKFFKRFYFCAKLLDDYQGAEIALNKIGICYHLAGDFHNSMTFHYKHQAFIEENKKPNQAGQMISLYNLGISMR